MIRPLLLGVLAAVLPAAPALAAPPPLPPVGHAHVNGAEIGYRIANPDAGGRGLVLICGYGMTMAEWPPQLVEVLARNRPVVIFDNRGLGNSRGPVKGLTVRTMAIDTLRLIRKLGLRRPDVLGWSMGGYIAQRVAIRRPRQIGRLVLAGTDPGSPQAVQAAPWVTEILTTATDPDDLLPILFPKSRLAAGQAWYQAIASQPGLVPDDFRIPERTMRQQTRVNDRRWFGPGRGTYRGLRRIRARTLVAHGSRDLVVPPGNAGILLRRIKRSTGIRFRVAGHGFLAQAPRAKARAINRFLVRR